MDFTTKDIGIDQLDLIKPLWEKLNQLHLQDSKYFKEHFRTFTFEKRCEKFRRMEGRSIKIEVVVNEILGIIGYCITTIGQEAGEVESLFVEEEFRKDGLGNMLVGSAIQWLKGNNCNKILVGIAEGHEEVFGFYMKNGFYPRLTYLELKE
ncbi:MAG: N-acetyltransferase [Firmicutes bacterium HGW-Firmicutes-7]|nr:MAG: N-acetyltransferase [Firmicutes bacterium HGW-Firmicutes-7]